MAAALPMIYEKELEQTVCACTDDVVLDLDKSRQTTLPSDFKEGGMASAKKLTPVFTIFAEHQRLDCTCRRSEL